VLLGPLREPTMLPVIVILHLVANAPADDLPVVGGFQPAVLARFDAVAGTAHGAPLAGPHAGVLGMTAGPDGLLHVASEGSDQVLRFDPLSGAYTGVLVGDDSTTPVDESGGLDAPVGLRLGIGAALWVTSIGDDAVKRYALRTGAFLGDLVGPSAAPTLLFGGVLCLGGARTLVGVSRANLTGRASVPVLLQGQAHQAGDVLHAQCVYRDPPTPGGSGANLSSSITFTLAP
jgi:hypothetical protein